MLLVLYETADGVIGQSVIGAKGLKAFFIGEEKVQAFAGGYPHIPAAVAEQLDDIVGAKLIAFARVVHKAAGAFHQHVDTERGRYPEVLLGVFEDAGDKIIVDGIGLSVVVVNEAIFPPVEPIEACPEGAYPKIVVAVFVEAHNAISGETAGLPVVMAIVHEFSSVIAIEAAEIGSDPQPVVFIKQETDDGVVGQAIGIGRVMHILAETVVFAVKKDQSASVGANPDVTGGIFDEFVHVIEAEAVGIFPLVAEERQPDAVLMAVADAGFGGAHPEGARAVEEHHRNAVFRQAFGVVFTMFERRYRPVFFVEDIHSAVVGRQPDLSFSVLDDSKDNVAAQFIWSGIG